MKKLNNFHILNYNFHIFYLILLHKSFKDSTHSTFEKNKIKLKSNIRI
jgi:hypothetical protein